jgi:hypothetical protein
MTLHPRLRPLISCFLVLPGLCSCMGLQSSSTVAQRATLEAQMKDAIEDVKQIVNQPVTQVVRRPDMEVATYRPGWFHEGSTKPEFNYVDVRKTRQTPYAQHKYVTSDLNPGIVFFGSELEFNVKTKYFYADRTLPKKKLTEEEMAEINRLYRIIGRCEDELGRLQ